MTPLVIATGYNRAGINKATGRYWADASGAFLPEARAFKKLHTAHLFEIVSPMPAKQRREKTEMEIRRHPGLDVLAVFGHGTATTLVATGHGIETKRQPSTIEGLAAAIASAPTTPDIFSPDLDVVLYACLTAHGKMGFADVLADCLPWAHVWAHSTAGHTTWNPHVELSGGPNGGDPVFVSGDGPRWKRWRDRLRDEQAFRLSFWCPTRGLGRADALEAVREGAER